MATLFNFGNKKSVNDNKTMITYKALNSYNVVNETSYVFNENGMEYLLLVDTLKRYFSNLFTYDFEDVYFLNRMERILFENGKCAIVKLPNEKWYPFRFKCEDQDLDIYGNPKKITIESKTNFNGLCFTNGESFEVGENTEIVKEAKEVENKNFVIVRNNSSGKKTLHFALNHIKKYLESMDYVYNSNYISQPKIWVIGLQGDKSVEDIKNGYNSKDPIIDIPDPLINSSNITFNQFTDTGGQKQEMALFLFNQLLKFLGLSTNDMVNKSSKVSQLEISKSDHFGNLLLEDMWKQRSYALLELSKLGLKIGIEELTDETEEKNKLVNEKSGEMGGNNGIIKEEEEENIIEKKKGEKKNEK